MSTEVFLEDAMESDAMLAYEINGQPLPAGNGFPVRLIVPGRYGICNVKWLSRIELSDRRFMGRDHVNIIGRDIDGQREFTDVSVTRMTVKSVVARVSRTQPGGRTRVFGAAWSGEGTPLRAVEVRVNDGPWQPAKLETHSIRTRGRFSRWTPSLSQPGSTWWCRGRPTRRDVNSRRRLSSTNGRRRTGKTTASSFALFR